MQFVLIIQVVLNKCKFARRLDAFIVATVGRFIWLIESFIILLLRERSITMNQGLTYQAGLYCRLSKDDDQQGESSSISTQKAILISYCQEHGVEIYDVFIDDGYSGLNFERPGFQRLLREIEAGSVNMVITKDLSRLGRDYIMTGYYSEIYFPSQGVRYIALADNFDSDNTENDIAPFLNILNEMYARDISRKIRAAKHQRAKDGQFVGAQAPFGYKKANHHLVVDPEAAAVVRRIYLLASLGLGGIEIAKQLEAERQLTPSAYKLLLGDTRFSRYCEESNPYCWRASTIQRILTDPVYLGTLTSLKTESRNYKTKQRKAAPKESWVVTENAHEAIITKEQLEAVRIARQHHLCVAELQRNNLFRGLLYCECCGHPLSVAHRKLTYTEDDLYRCMYHFRHPDVCPKTHAIYHSMLYPYVLNQVRAFAKSMRRRKVKSRLAEYGDITELSPEILKQVIERIEIGHVTSRSVPAKVIRIYWRLG